MSQEQQKGPQKNEDQQHMMSHEGQQQQQQQETIKYGDVFNLSGDLANKPVAPRDAAMMQAAETAAFGDTQSGGPADAMTTAAVINEQAGFVGHGDATDIAKNQGVTITGTRVPGARMVTETFAGQVVGQRVQVDSTHEAAASPPAAAGEVEQDKLTIGQALEATIQTAGNKPVEYSDAAAVAEAEMRATGRNVIIQGGYAASAQSAAAYNTGMIGDENKIKLKDVLAGASRGFPTKEVTHVDAEAVAHTEQRNSPNLTTHPGGIGTSMDTAARLNDDDADLR
ncbi:hypothetical protein Dsin_029620 [Dipteronia sinensis]|uniref:SMP domain-containing protein n=1 Tax=Dipteronia sinensis TaxID=43782 RepID=A0AAE0DVQ5_9ROSI|nr:hypothetical protein Dsin_029620 [Dipteronia sinensis]